MFSIVVPNDGVEYTNELHYRMAAQWNGYEWEQFLELIERDLDEAQTCIAAYDSRVQIDAVVRHSRGKKLRAYQQMFSTPSRNTIK